MSCAKLMPFDAKGKPQEIPTDMQKRLERMASHRIGRVRECFGFGTWTLDDALKAAYLQGLADMAHAASLSR
jgi:hypothetical protein